MRAHTRFDEEGNATTEYEPVEEVKQKPAAETQEPEEEAEDENPEEKEPEKEEAEAEVDEKLNYRSVPSFFTDHKSRTAKWCGKHTRFPEDQEDDMEPAASSPEMMKEVDKLIEALPKAM